jgi:hypothetical protein
MRCSLFQAKRARAKYKQLQTDDMKQPHIITSDARQVWSYCLTPKRKLSVGMLVYPKHRPVEEFKEEYAMKHGITIFLKTLDLSKEAIADFYKECTTFATEVERVIEKKATTSHACA